MSRVTIICLIGLVAAVTAFDDDHEQGKNESGFDSVDGTTCYPEKVWHVPFHKTYSHPSYIKGFFTGPSKLCQLSGPKHFVQRTVIQDTSTKG